mmetsp:Transcript_42199/g.95226  ORF Transcript_42199/g.95226 Transcript_42199/m.95226 type:complete len:329 (-) Transcript_42199:1-987(-)
MAFFFSSSGLSANSFSQALSAFLAHDRMKSHLSMRPVSTSTWGRTSFAPASTTPCAAASFRAGAVQPASSASESLLSPFSRAATCSMPASSASESLLSGSGSCTLRAPLMGTEFMSIMSWGSSASESSLSSSSSWFASSSSSSFSATFSSSSFCSICSCCVWWRLSSMTTSGFFFPSWASFSEVRMRLYLCMSVSPNSVMGCPISRSLSITSPMLTGGSASSSPSKASSTRCSGMSLVAVWFLLSLFARCSESFRKRSSSSAFCFSSSILWFSKYSSTRFASISLRLIHFCPVSSIVFWALACRCASTPLSKSMDLTPGAHFVPEDSR